MEHIALLLLPLQQGFQLCWLLRSQEDAAGREDYPELQRDVDGQGLAGVHYCTDKDFFCYRKFF